jgi:hypothetical protein
MIFSLGNDAEALVELYVVALSVQMEFSERTPASFAKLARD